MSPPRRWRRGLAGCSCRSPLPLPACSPQPLRTYPLDGYARRPQLRCRHGAGHVLAGVRGLVLDVTICSLPHGIPARAVLHDWHEPSPVVAELIRRSNPQLRSSQHHYGGGNTSAKAVVEDPVSGDDVEVMWVKGSGGDLGTCRLTGCRPWSWIGSEASRRCTGARSRRTSCTSCRLLPLRSGRRLSQHRHLDAEATQVHVDHPPDAIIALAAPPTVRADQAVLPGGGGLGAMAATRVRARAADRAPPRVPPRPQGRGPRRPRPGHIGPDLTGASATPWA